MAAIHLLAHHWGHQAEARKRREEWIYVWESQCHHKGTTQMFPWSRFHKDYIFFHLGHIFCLARSKISPVKDRGKEGTFDRLSLRL
jgi:hypothetical protein